MPPIDIVFREPAWLLVIPVLLLGGALLARGRGVPKTALLLRALIICAVLGAIADPVRPGTAGPAPLLVLVDQSASLVPEARQAAWQTALRIRAERSDADTIVAAIGADVAVVAEGEAPEVDAEGTDLARALDLARGLQASGGRVLLISDGGATTPGADAVARQLGAAGIHVDVLPLEAGTQPDARVASIQLPAGLRAGQSFRGSVVVESSFAGPAELQLSFNGQQVSGGIVQLEAGRNTFPLPGNVPLEGVQRFRAELLLQDAYAANNALDKTAVVGPQPRVLVVERQPDSAATLRDTLEQQGVLSEARRPQDVPSRLSELRRFDAIVLQDVPATDFTLDQQSSLREFVRSLGHGLVALGGANSYSLGGYKGTPLEEVLPVKMDTPPRRERQQVALLLIIDRSASMHGFDPRTSKLELAKGAALAATQVLVADDRVGVLTFDTDTYWTVPFTRIGEGLQLSEIQDRISGIAYGGGTDIYRGIGIGLPQLAQQDVTVKHAVLLTDGRSYTASDTQYEELMQATRDNGITLSTIAIGDDADTALLDRLAKQGGGRYHFASDPQELPRLTLMETEIARQDPRVEGTFQPQPAGGHPITRGFVPSRFPQLDGYVAVTLKPEAEAVLMSPEQDPIMSAWQYGLGRAVAWTSDSGQEWGAGWRDWDESGLLWTQALGYTFPDPTQGLLTVRVEERQDGSVLVADARDDDGAPLDLADVGARVTDPSGAAGEVRLKQIAPGRYEAPFTSEQPGAYLVGAALRKGELRLEAGGGWVRAYPAEYAVQPDRGLLERIAATSGGQVLQSADQTADALRGEAPRPTQAYWPWLIGLALLLFPLEIAVRRGWLRKR